MSKSTKHEQLALDLDEQRLTEKCLAILDRRLAALDALHIPVPDRTDYALVRRLYLGITS